MLTVTHLPDWNTHGKKAGFLRNRTIVEDSERVVAFWNGTSNGTKSTIQIANQLRLPVEIIPEDASTHDRLPPQLSVYRLSFPSRDFLRRPSVFRDATSLAQVGRVVSGGTGGAVETSMNTTTKTTEYIVSGTTYDLRDQLRQAGAHYNGESKTWRMDEEAYDRLRTIVGRIASPTGNAKARAYERAWDGLVIEEV